MCGALPPTLNGTLKYCNNMEYWNIRILGKWNIGHLGAWSPGSWESEILGFGGPEACEPGYILGGSAVACFIHKVCGAYAYLYISILLFAFVFVRYTLPLLFHRLFAPF